MLDILEWALDVIGVTYRRLDGRYWCTSHLLIELQYLFNMELPYLNELWYQYHAFCMFGFYLFFHFLF